MLLLLLRANPSKIAARPLHTSGGVGDPITSGLKYLSGISQFRWLSWDTHFSRGMFSLLSQFTGKHQEAIIFLCLGLLWSFHPVGRTELEIRLFPIITVARRQGLALMEGLPRGSGTRGILNRPTTGRTVRVGSTCTQIKASPTPGSFTQRCTCGHNVVTK
jgi:hypothetical protein